LTPAAGGAVTGITECGPGAVTWQVEAVHVDRTGHRAWFVTQGGGKVVDRPGAADVGWHLAARGGSGRDLVPLDDGCQTAWTAANDPTGRGEAAVDRADAGYLG